MSQLLKNPEDAGEKGEDECCTAIREPKQMLSTLLLANSLPSIVVLTDVGYTAAFRNDHALERQRSNQNASLTTLRSNK